MQTGQFMWSIRFLFFKRCLECFQLTQTWWNVSRVGTADKTNRLGCRQDGWSMGPIIRVVVPDVVVVCVLTSLKRSTRQFGVSFCSSGVLSCDRCSVDNRLDSAILVRWHWPGRGHWAFFLLGWQLQDGSCSSSTLPESMFFIVL